MTRAYQLESRARVLISRFHEGESRKNALCSRFHGMFHVKHWNRQHSEHVWTLGHARPVLAYPVWNARVCQRLFQDGIKVTISERSYNLIGMTSHTEFSSLGSWK